MIDKVILDENNHLENFNGIVEFNKNKVTSKYRFSIKISK